MNGPEAHFGRLPMRFRTRSQSPMDRAPQDTMTIASTIPLPRPRLNLGQSLTPLVLTKTQLTTPKRDTPPVLGGVSLFKDDQLAVLA
jgi:hypothetical protein